jgi:transposase-like protein
VLGMRQRGGETRAQVIPDTTKDTLHGAIRDHVEPGANVYTDAYRSYRGLSADYDHEVVDHAEKYVDGQVHTNGLENFWSLVKRGLHGTYISVEPFHLFRYIDERVFTYNLRELDDYGRFATVLRRVAGRRLTYAEVTGR